MQRFEAREQDDHQQRGAPDRKPAVYRTSHPSREAVSLGDTESRGRCGRLDRLGWFVAQTVARTVARTVGHPGIVGHGTPLVALSPIGGEVIPADRSAVAARSRISRPTSNWRPGRVRAINRSCT